MRERTRHGLTASQISLRANRVDSVATHYATWAWVGLSESRVDVEFRTWIAASKESLLARTELATIQKTLNELITRYPKDSDDLNRHVDALEREHTDLLIDQVWIWIKNCPRLMAESDTGYDAQDLYWDETDDVSGCLYWGHHAGLDEAKLRVCSGTSRWLVEFRAIADARNIEISFEGTVSECPREEMISF